MIVRPPTSASAAMLAVVAVLAGAVGFTGATSGAAGARLVFYATATLLVLSAIHELARP